MCVLLWNQQKSVAKSGLMRLYESGSASIMTATMVTRSGQPQEYNEYQINRRRIHSALIDTVRIFLKKMDVMCESKSLCPGKF